MKQTPIITGIKWSLLSNIIQVISGIFIVLILTKFLGPNNFGLLETIIALVIISALISDFGISPSTSRFIAKSSDMDIIKEYVKASIYIKIITSLAVIIATINFIPLIGDLLKVELDSYKFLIVGLILLKSLYTYFGKLYQGLKRLDILSRLNILKNIITPIIIVYLLSQNYNVKAYLLSELFIISVLVVISVIFILKEKLIEASFSVNKCLELIKYSLPMLLISFSFLIYMKSDIFLVQYFSDSVQVGLYSLAVIIVTKIQTIFVAIGTAVGPSFAALNINDRRALFLNTFRVVLMLALPISVGLFIISDLLILTVFGEEYRGTILVLKIYCVFLFFYCLNAVFSPLLDYIGKAKARSLLMALSSIANIILNIIMIPLYGIMGAALSTLCTYTLYALLVNYFAINSCVVKEDLRRIYSYTFKILISTVTMSVLILFIKLIEIPSVLFIILSVILGMVFYYYCLWKLDVISAKDLIVFKSKIRS